MLTNIALFLVGAHLGAKHPKYATMLVDQAVAFTKSLVVKVKQLLAKK